MSEFYELLCENVLDNTVHCQSQHLDLSQTLSPKLKKTSSIVIKIDVSHTSKINNLLLLLLLLLLFLLLL
jgi:hypothetical protein